MWLDRRVICDQKRYNQLVWTSAPVSVMEDVHVKKGFSSIRIMYTAKKVGGPVVSTLFVFPRRNVVDLRSARSHLTQKGDANMSTGTFKP